jgi:hypothetical protein
MRETSVIRLALVCRPLPRRPSPHPSAGLPRSGKGQGRKMNRRLNVLLFLVVIVGAIAASPKVYDIARVSVVDAIYTGPPSQ